MFLCGTAAEIVPVGAIDGHRYQVGPMTRALMADFQKLVRAARQRGLRGIDPSDAGRHALGGLTAGALSTFL